MIPLPEDLLPQDEKRTSVLFAPVRARSVNPQDWDSKLTFWKNLIGTYCVRCKVYSFKLDDLKDAFKRNGRSPGCLDVVFEEMVKNGECVPLDKFFESSPDTWSRWAADVLVKKPLLWSYNVLKDKFVTKDKEITYVHQKTIEEESEKFLSSVPNDYKNKVINLKELLDIQVYDLSDPNSVKLLLHQLTKNGKAAVKELALNTDIEDNGTKAKHLLIKIADKKVQPITNVEIGIHTLEQNEKTLLDNVEELESKIDQLQNEAKEHLKKGHRQMAKSCLRKRHELENRLEKRVNALHNVQTLLAKVHDAGNDSQVLDSYKVALSSLKDVFKTAGLSEDSVSKTMLELGEVLEIHDEIQTSLAQPVGDDVDVEEELAELLAEDNGVHPGKPDNTDSSIDSLGDKFENLTLPNVPKGTPEAFKSKISL